MLNFENSLFGLYLIELLVSDIRMKALLRAVVLSAMVLKTGWSIPPLYFRENFDELDWSSPYPQCISGLDIQDINEIILQDEASLACITISLEAPKIVFSISELKNLDLLAGLFIQFSNIGFIDVRIQEGTDDFVELEQGCLSVNTEASESIIRLAAWFLETQTSLINRLTLCRLCDEKLLSFFASELQKCRARIDEVNFSEISELSHLCRALYGRMDIQEFCLSGCRCKNYESIVEMFMKTRLQRIRITDCKLDDERLLPIIAFLGGSETVEFVDLSYNRIGDKGAMRLAEMLKKNGTIKNLFLKGIDKGGNLRSLVDEDKDKDGNFIGDDGVKAFLKVFKGRRQLEVLDLRFLRRISPEMKKELCRIRRKREIQTNILFDQKEVRFLLPTEGVVRPNEEEDESEPSEKRQRRMKK